MIRSKLIPSKRKYLEWEIIKAIAFIIVIVSLLYQSYQMHQFITMQTDTLNVLNDVTVQTDQTTTKPAETVNFAAISPYEEALGTELCDYVFEVYQMYPVDPELVFKVMKQESNFNAGAISETNDYGLMQINESNYNWLAADLGITDLLDPKQNILCGMYMLYCIQLNEYDSVHKDLMVYNMGSRGAIRLWDKGIVESGYSQKVLGE